MVHSVVTSDQAHRKLNLFKCLKHEKALRSNTSEVNKGHSINGPTRAGENRVQYFIGKGLNIRFIVNWNLIVYKSLDAKFNFKTSRWTSAGHEIALERWWNLTTPDNKSHRNFPIMNDRLFWRWSLISPIQQLHYGEEYLTAANDYQPRIYSTTDLYKKGFHIGNTHSL